MKRKSSAIYQKGFNTQPPEGGWAVDSDGEIIAAVSTHSRPKAAGSIWDNLNGWFEFQHTAARRRLALLVSVKNAEQVFQHTAARRRLVRAVFP